MSGPQTEGVWGRKRARWYTKGLRYSDYPDRVVSVMESVVKGCSSLLDVGAGCGALCIPLARVLDHVTALDSSPAMLDELRKTARSAGIENIRTQAATWEEAESHIGEFDVVLCANVPGVLDDPSNSILRLEKHAKRLVFLVVGTPKQTDKFFLRELWPLIYGTDPPHKPDYFAVYGALYRMGIFANVVLVDYNFDQPFQDIDEAVSFWRDHMRLDGHERDAALKEFLSARLERSGDLLWVRIPKQSAVMWWETPRRK